MPNWGKRKLRSVGEKRAFVGDKGREGIPDRENLMYKGLKVRKIVCLGNKWFNGKLYINISKYLVF